MNRINNYNQNNPSFSGVTKDEFLKMNKEEKTKALTEKVAERLAENAERYVPQNGKFTRIFVSFDVPETKNEAQIAIEHDELNPKDLRRVVIAAHHGNSDRIFSNYMFKGTKDEVLNYLKDKNNHQEFVDTVKKLSDKIDEYYSSL